MAKVPLILLHHAIDVDMRKEQDTLTFNAGADTMLRRQYTSLSTMKDPIAFPLKRVLLKLSGEALMGEQSHGLFSDVLLRVADEIKSIHAKGIQIGVVIGGGNIFRGAQGARVGLERTTGDYMGMLATVINGLALQSVLEGLGLEVRLQSAIPMETICESYVRRRAIHHLEKGRIVIFAGGTGSPFFTTDTTAVLRASEMCCDALLKGTKVDGIYSADPKTNPEAKRFPTLSYEHIIRDQLAVMDMAAIALARDNCLPVVVFSIKTPGALHQAVEGNGTFTVVQTRESV